jgi:hypothetical protein
MRYHFCFMTKGRNLAPKWAGLRLLRRLRSKDDKSPTTFKNMLQKSQCLCIFICNHHDSTFLLAPHYKMPYN